MVTIKSFDETDIEVEDRVVKITQTSSVDYSRNYIEIPVHSWGHFVAVVEEEIRNPS